ncbi:MFS general substrate transporter [Hypoxylon fragiforme]|uniref:MFS general substrate transporter n=1 Tax=Hypoxylon fragiforme TaxID=63214 RepID=UPI0020C67C31|nr:MFS general substrate transporter [Hypoxylon fragiforme]KAI2607107.1 MFS general substrate transporter [Hypoxylon fragiforme]
MVKDLHDGDDTDASFYAGLLVSAYAVAEALTAIGWGALSDRYGRKPVVLFGLGGVAISSLIFGLAQKYWVALLARFIGGALNGNVAVMQTMVAEMVKVPEHEPKAYATQPFVWTLGGIIGSAMGGFLAQPAIFYPSLFPADGLFGRYPYLLPNLVSVVVIVLAIAQGIIFLEETNPAIGAKGVDEDVIEEDDDVVDERTSLQHGVGTARSQSRAGSDRPLFVEESLPVPVEQNFDLRRTSFGTVGSIQLPPPPPRSRSQPKRTDSFDGRPFNFTIIMVTIALVLVSYHQMAFSTLLPTHLLDKPAAAPGEIDLVGGLGYTVHDVGVYLSVNGILGLFVQAVIFPIFVDRVGVWKSFVLNIIFYPLAYVVMPFLSAVPSSLVSPGIYLSLILQSFFGILVIPCALILLKDATPSPLVLGKVNGLAMSACCLARTLSPPLVGIIYSAGGSAAAWFSCAGVAVLGVVQLLWVPRKHIHNPVVGADAMKSKIRGDLRNDEEEAAALLTGTN